MFHLNVVNTGYFLNMQTASTDGLEANSTTHYIFVTIKHRLFNSKVATGLSRKPLSHLNSIWISDSILDPVINHTLLNIY